MAMVLAIAAILATFACAFFAERGDFSFWWTLLPAFLSSVLQLIGNPSDLEAALREKKSKRYIWIAEYVVATTLMAVAFAGLLFWIFRGLRWLFSS
ncbi:hypothetical protein AUC45_06220 [Erythrobacter sp. YT30]|nr:hypothetical protein AUC45_06220 [Erythrobacter sp. YT30]